jgi:hypothetical protein
MKKCLTIFALALIVGGCKSKPKYDRLTFCGNQPLCAMAYGEARKLQGIFGIAFLAEGISVEHSDTGYTYAQNRKVRIRRGMAPSAERIHMRHELMHLLLTHQGWAHEGHPDWTMGGQRIRNHVQAWK